MKMYFLSQLFIVIAALGTVLSELQHEVPSNAPRGGECFSKCNRSTDCSEYKNGMSGDGISGCLKCMKICGGEEKCPEGMVFNSCVTSRQMDCTEDYSQGSMRCSRSNFCACPRCKVLQNGTCVRKCKKKSRNFAEVYEMLEACRGYRTDSACKEIGKTHDPTSKGTLTRPDATILLETMPTLRYTTESTLSSPEISQQTKVTTSGMRERTPPGEESTRRVDMKSSTGYFNELNTCLLVCQQSGKCDSTDKMKNLLRSACSGWLGLYCVEDRADVVECFMQNTDQVVEACPTANSSAKQRLGSCYSCWRNCSEEGPGTTVPSNSPLQVEREAERCDITCIDACVSTSKDVRKNIFALLPKKCKKCVRDACTVRYEENCVYGVISGGCMEECVDINACDFCYTC